MPESLNPRLLSFYLASLHELGGALARTPRKLDQNKPLRESLYRVLGTFAVGAGMILLWDEDEALLRAAAAKGLRAPAEGLPLKPALARALAAGRRPFHPHLLPGGLADAEPLFRELIGRRNIQLIVPLTSGHEFAGLLLLGPRVNGRPLSPLETDVLTEMAGVMALRITDARARRRLDRQLHETRRLNRELRRIYLETVRALASVIDGPEQDHRPGHSARVAALAAQIGRRLGLDRDRCEALYLAGLLHDVGKQIIDRDLLRKSGPLAPGERARVEEHAAAGYELISHLRFPWGDVAEIIRHHHERLDGTGYPDRLRGDELSIEARVLMMAEAFDSMASDQPWRPRLTIERIVEQIEANLGLQFEPRVVQALCDAVQDGLESPDGAAGEAAVFGAPGEPEFVPHLRASFDPALIHQLLGELRRRLNNPRLNRTARVIEIVEPAG